ncbi:MAG TPA: helix-turn-helix domain-containing protein [Candidatus Saccharimonadales bacterium]
MTPLSFQSSSLLSWGVFKGRRRKSDSPYIESLWEGVAQNGGIHLTAADATIDIACLKRRGTTHLFLSGPASKVQVEQFEAGDEVLTIRLRTGVYLPFIAGARLADTDTFLPNAGSKHFWLHGSRIAFPNFDNAEIFIEQLAMLGLLSRNISLENALENRSSRNSIRTMQRLSLATTGLTMSCIRQIKRAEQAKGLLATNYPFTRVAYDVGYSNPGHMTNAFKYFFGRTPSALRKLIQQDQLAGL